MFVCEYNCDCFPYGLELCQLDSLAKLFSVVVVSLIH